MKPGAWLLGLVATALFGCNGCATKIAEAPETPAALIVAEPRAAQPQGAIAPAAVAPPPVAASASADDGEDDWGNAALNCEGERCLAIAARVPAGAPPDVAANVRAKANGANGRCLVEAMMVAWNDDAAESCNEAAKHALTKADERLIRATPFRAARAWRRLEAREAREAQQARTDPPATTRR